MWKLRSTLLVVALWSAQAHAFDHTPYDRLLRAHVKRGRVDYAGIKREARAVLDTYLEAVARARLQGMSRPDKLAFYLNAYNALVLRAVVERYPLKSVREVPGFFKRLRHKVAGKTLSLDELEHRVIRPTFKDGRVHFALVCAARSCPPLRAAAFHGRTVDGVLERLTRSFVNSWQGVRVRGKVQVSQLFDWFAGDFKRDGGTVGRYLARYHKRHADLLARTQQLEFLPYDWSLNEQE